ncbi:hypothetical protein ACFE04_019284 [Oxalis oulophora]
MTFPKLSSTFLSLMIFFLTTNSFAFSQDLISIACNGTIYVDLCQTTLRSDPKSKTSDLNGLANIALNSTLQFGISTLSYIGKYSKSISNKCLIGDCKQVYTQAIGDLQDGIVDLQIKNYGAVNSMVLAAMTDAGTCLICLRQMNERLKFPWMTKKSLCFNKLCSNSLAIIKLLGICTAAAMDHKEIKQSHFRHCSFTRFPNLCVQTLSGNENDNSVHVISVLVNKTITESRLLGLHFGCKSTCAIVTEDDRHAQFLTGYCKTLIRLSVDRLEKSLVALRKSPGYNKHDIQTWLSAALTFQQACKDSVTKDHISRKIDYLSQLGRNALALVNRMSSDSKKKAASRKLGNRKFPNWVSSKDRKLLREQANSVKVNAVVAKDGTGNYRTISAAINDAYGKRFVIYVKAGVYKEKIRTNKEGITLIGDGKYSTVIVGGDCVAKGSSMPGSATFAITGDGFIARDIGFQNTAGPQGKQALALFVASDHSVFYRCNIEGYQDTLYALALRQFYRECDIYGTVDFIFGNAAAVFQNCELILRRPQYGAYNTILANGRSYPSQNTGFSVQNCRITVSSDLASVKSSVNSYLGRPWKAYSRAIVMESTIDAGISPRGWIEWVGKSNSLRTFYFAEYANRGAGARTSNRVNWPGFHIIGARQATKFTVREFLDGTSWLPSTGVTFESGL